MQYVVGGLDSPGIILSTMEVYDLQTSKWAAALPMSTKRYGCGVAEMDGLLYVVGVVILSHHSSKQQSTFPQHPTAGCHCHQWQPSAMDVVL